MMIKRTEKEDKGMQGGGIYKTNKEEDEEQGEARLTQRNKRSIINSTSKTSYGPLVTWTAFLVIHLACMFSQGLEIEPVPMVLGDQDNPWKTPIHNFTYCLGSGEPLRLLEHRDFAEVSNHSDFKRFVWWAENQTGGALIMWEPFKNKTPLVTFKDPTKYQQYQHWGLEILNVTREDEEVYLAQLVMEDTYNESRSKVAILSPPVLESKKLEIRRQVEGDNVTLTCGKVASFGDPPITLQLKTSEGQVLNSSYSQGTLSVTLPKEQDANDFVCEIDWNNSLAATCLSYGLTAWKNVGPPFPSTTPPIPTTSGLPQSKLETTTTTTTTIATEGTTKKGFEATPETAAEEDMSVLNYVLHGTLAVLVLIVVANLIHSRRTKEEGTARPTQPEVAEIPSLDTVAKERIDTNKTPV